ncbi:MAG: glycosyltransferase [Sinobacteraceae bacterium]|nr:glycosyltransferase [Nevskiaceae bacterium]
MNSLLFVAVGAGPPWTEGRKNLVRDLLGELRARGFDVRMIAGGARTTFWQFAGSLLELWRCLALRPPACIVQFPHGRFRGWRGWVNRAMARAVRFSAALRRVPTLTVLYSADGCSLIDARERFGAIAAVGATAAGVAGLRLGAVVRARHPGHRCDASQFRLLFLCGYQRATKAAVESVLYERGLLRLFEACQDFRHPVTLTVAAPLLRSPSVRRHFETMARRLCPSLRLVLEATADPHVLLAAQDLFVFPYAVEHEVFIPSSLLEAMMVGVPAVASDRIMYRALTRGGGIPRCELAADDSVEALRSALCRVVDDYPAALTRAAHSRAWVLENWTIPRATDDLIAAIQQVSESRPAPA